MNGDINENDLDWRALCYAAGELDAPAAEEFELRLADDQAAREALARAVELTHTIAAVEAQSTQSVNVSTTTKTSWNTRLAWMTVGGLAAALLVMLWSGVVDPTWRIALHQLNAKSQYQLAMAWHQTASEIDSVRSSDLWPAGVVIDDDDRQADLHLASYEIGDEAWLEEAPSWMMAAVYEVSNQSSQSETAIQ